jgi:hypothetical protein
MRRTILILSMLAAAFLAGCFNDQPKDHVGAWEGKAFSILQTLNPTYTFTEDGVVQEMHQGDTAPKEGTYKVDYSKNPVWIDVKWADGGVQTGIFRFVGTGKRSMELCLVFGERRPADFGGAGTLFLKRK